MGAASERRALLLEADDDYNPYLTVDINEYLIQGFPTLTARHRQSVWHLCQNDDDFNYDSIHDQIDNWVYEYAEANTDVVLDEIVDDSSDSSEESDDEVEAYLSVDVERYLQDNYDEIDENELKYMIELITWEFNYSQVYSQIDDIIAKFNDGEFDDELDDNDSEKTATE